MVLDRKVAPALKARLGRPNLVTVLTYDDQPAFVRFLAGAGGAALILTPWLNWSATSTIAGPQVQRGVESWHGWFVLVLGLATVAAAVMPRFLPLTIFTGLAAGAVAGGHLVDLLASPSFIDAGQFVGVALVLTVGGAAVVGVAGVIAAAVALSVEAAMRR